MSEYIAISCSKLLQTIAQEKERLSAHPSVHFADCKRLCTRCEYFNNVTTLTVGQLSTLQRLLEQILRFIKSHTNRPNYYQMTKPSARRNYLEVLAGLNQEMDELRLCGIGSDTYNRRLEDLEDYEETFRSLVTRETEELIQDFSEDIETNMIELEEAVAEDVENMVHYLNVSKLPTLTKEELKTIENNLKNISIQVSIRRGKMKSHVVDDDMNHLIGKLMHSDDISSLPSKMEVYRATQLEGFRKPLQSIQVSNMLLGAGGFGEVYVGKISNCEVAIKVIKNVNHIRQECEIEQEQLKCIENEILLMAHVASPCVLSVYGYIAQPREVFVVMELSSYGALSSLLRDRTIYEKLFPLELCISWFLDIISAIEFIHSKLIQHRDIKPDNLLLFPGLKLKLTDFGLAKERLSSVSTNNKSNITVAGSGAFMAPEIRMGSKSEYASDIFSFGVTVIQILSRKNPQVSNIKGQFDKAFGLYEDSPSKTKLRTCILNCLKFDESLPLNILRPSASFLSYELQALLLIEQSDTAKVIVNTSIAREIENTIQQNFQVRKQQTLKPNTDQKPSDVSAAEKVQQNAQELENRLKEAEAGRKRAEAEASRLREAEEGRKRAEAEASRLREAEEGRKRAEAEASRLREAEEGRKRAEAEASRLREAEEGRKRAEAEAKRLREAIKVFYFDNDALQQAVKLFCSNKQQAIAQYGPIATWNTSKVTNMHSLFKELKSFNEDISGWDVSNVTHMYAMFCDASSFNQPLNSWNVSNVTDMGYMFLRATKFNQPLASWNVSRVTNMSHMFCEAVAFNQSLTSWNVSHVTNMYAMFLDVSSFNYPLNNWNVSNVTDMGHMFCGATSFNQPLASWNVSKVTNMNAMFYHAKAFNQPLASWSISPTTDLTNMFLDAVSFHQSRPSTRR